MQKMIESFVDSTRKANCKIICPKINCVKLSIDFELKGSLSEKETNLYAI